MRLILPVLCSAVFIIGQVPAHAVTFDVNCDDGGDLGEVLNHLARVQPPGLIRGENTSSHPVAFTIRISGTCIGNFVIANSGVKLEGVGPGPEAAVLEGKDPIQSVTPVVDVRSVHATFFENLTVTGGSTGIRIRHSDALIVGCEFRGNGNGVFSEGSETFINDSLFTDNRIAVQSVAADQISVYDSLLIDNEDYGVFVIGGSSLVADGGEIRGSLRGIQVLDNARAFLRQPLVVGDTTGGSHIAAVNHSTVTLNDGVLVTGDDNIEIVNQSLLQAYEATIATDLVLVQSGRAFLNDTVVDGNVTLARFSNAFLDADISGSVACDGTSDADCEGGTIGSVSGCASCAP